MEVENQKEAVDFPVEALSQVEVVDCLGEVEVE
jgi:hypothetical protein